MKIGIVIPLKAKAVSKNWDLTCENVKATVNSVLAQNDNRYQSILVGHDTPNFVHELDSNNRFTFKKITEFQPPKVGENEEENQLKYEIDRCTKILKGIAELKKHHSDITYWFALDADDLIHNEFVQILQSYDGLDGIILDRGYFLFKSTNIINLEDSFSTYCGSSAVLSDRLFSISDETSDNNFRSIPFGAISHVNMKKELSDKGYNITIPEERIIMYVRDHGENISNDAYCNSIYKKFKKYIKMFLKKKKISPEIKKCFGLS